MWIQLSMPDFWLSRFIHLFAELSGQHKLVLLSNYTWLAWILRQCIFGLCLQWGCSWYKLQNKYFALTRWKWILTQIDVEDSDFFFVWRSLRCYNIGTEYEMSLYGHGTAKGAKDPKKKRIFQNERCVLLPFYQNPSTHYNVAPYIISSECPKEK